MHPHGADARHAGLYMRRAHARNAGLSDVRAQPSPWSDAHLIGVGRRNQNFTNRMRGGDFLLLRCGRKAHIRRRNLRGNEALDRLLGALWGMARSKVRSR